MTSRRWILLGLALCLSAAARAAGREIALSIPKVPLAEAARLITERTGVPVRVDANAGKMVGPLDYSDSPVALEKLLSLLAQWAGLEVRPEGDGYALVAKAPASDARPAAPLPAPPSESISRAKPHVALVIAYLPQERARSQGTGFVVGIDGLLLTNYHVVKGASAVQVVFADNGSYYAAVAARDEEKDLAVLRVATRFSDYLRLGDSDQVREGDDVALTGYPMALELLQNGIALYSSTAKATVNAVRPARGSETLPYIQIDAPVNPGNSGGPLYRLDTGHVIGVVQCKIAYDQTQDSGVSFAIPINLARRLIADARASSIRPPTPQEGEQIAASLPLAMRLPPPSAGSPETPVDAAPPAITRPFDLLAPGEPVRVPDPPDAPGLLPLYAPGGKMLADPLRPRLYVADFGGNSLVVIDTAARRVVDRIFTGSKPYGLALGTDNRTLYVSNSGGSEVFILDLEKLTPIGRIPLSFRPFDLATGSGGRLYVTAAARSHLRVIDLRRQMEQGAPGDPLAGGAILAIARSGQTGFAAERADAPAVVAQISESGRLEPATVADAGVLGSNLQDLALSPDGSRVYLASLSLGYVSVLDADGLRPLGQLEVGGTPSAVALSPDGYTAYVCHRKSHVDRFDTRTFLRTGTIPLPGEPLRILASPDGKQLFVQLASGVLIADIASFGPPAPEAGE